MIQRRTFTAAAMLAATPLARAQGPVEGTHYVKLAQPLPVGAAGKIEVVEFFSYACPHCNQFEPMLEAWIKKLPPDVSFRRAPVPFLPNAENFQKLYYTLEAMGQVEALQRRVFAAVHTERQRLDKVADMAALVAKHGGDGAKFTELFNSFSVQTKARQATQLSAAYKIDGVPALGIHGRFYTSGSLAGTLERSIAVAEFLIQQSRKSS